jgi:hypothetical protein
MVETGPVSGNTMSEETQDGEKCPESWPPLLRQTSLVKMFGADLTILMGSVHFPFLNKDLTKNMQRHET